MRAGDVLDGRYRIDAPLAKGGMGAVYRATHIGTERAVALKVINRDLVASPVMLERFRREAKAAGRLNHPHVVNVTDFGLTELGGKQIAYLVMEYLHGRTLRDLLKERKRLEVGLAIEITEQVALAVDAAHKLGIVHRDLKPENIWLEPNGVDKFHAKVLDFGIAKLRGELEVPPMELPPSMQKDSFEDGMVVVGDVPRAVTMASGVAAAPQGRPRAGLVVNQAPQESGSLTQTSTHARVSWRNIGSPTPASQSANPSSASRGSAFPSMGTGGTPASGQLTEVGGILGTPFYMAPEQFRGDAVDERADIYALGVCVYQMLEGDVPHRGSVGQLALIHIDKAPPPPMHGVPRPVESIVMRALAHEPELRHPTARLLAAGLKGAAEAEDVVRRRALSMPSSEIVACVGATFIPYIVPMTALVLAAQASTRVWFLAPLLTLCAASLSALSTMASAAFLRSPAGEASTKVRARMSLRMTFAGIAQWPRAIAGVLLGNPMTPALVALYPRTPGADIRALSFPVRQVLRALTLRTWACAIVVTCAVPFAALARGLALDALRFSLRQGTTPSGATAAVVAVFGVLTALGPVIAGALLQLPVSMTAVELFDNARSIAGDDVVRPSYARRTARARTLYGFVPAVVGVVGWLLVLSAGFEAAVLRDASETVAVLVNLGANPNPTASRQPLHDAAFNGKSRTVEALLAGGALPDSFDQLEGPTGGATPLIAAVTAGSPECVRMLLQYGADPNLAAKFGENPLHIAVTRKPSPERTQIIRMLLERGADAHKAGPDGKTPLEIATSGPDAVVAKLFSGR